MPILELQERDLIKSAKEAETTLINALREHDIVRRDRFEDELGLYSASKYELKPDRILAILEYIWPNYIGSPPFELFRDFERFLNALNKRDHFVHQFDVFLLGWNILEYIIENTRVKEAVFKLDSEWDIFWTWLMTAMSHDLGYPLELISDMTNKLSSLYGGFELLNIAERFGSIYHDSTMENDPRFWSFKLEKEVTINTYTSVDLRRLLIQALNPCFNEEGIKQIEKDIFGVKSHGLLSAVILAKAVLKKYREKEINVTWNEYQKKKEFIMLCSSLAAIYLHDKKDNAILERISFWDNPFAYILFVTDNLQDWNRGFIPIKEWPNYYLTGFKRNINTFQLEYTLFDEEWPLDMISRVKESIDDKKALLNIPKRDGAPLEVNIELTYKPNRELKELGKNSFTFSF